MHRNQRSEAALAGAVTAALLVAGCSPGETDSGEGIVLTCTVCADSPTDVFAQYNHELTMRFNEEYEGQYRIEILPPVGSQDEAGEAYRRLALAGNLPDLFSADVNLVTQLESSAQFMDFQPFLDAEPEFANSFYNGTLEKGSTGTLVIPEQRSIAGVFYNTAVLEAAGISDPPTTWEGLLAAGEAIKSAGLTPLAVDGAWITVLWLSHLIGTQDGGAEYLNGLLAEREDAAGDFASNSLWVEAVEFLRDLHVDGFVNEDAFHGEFLQANALYVAGEAASIVNGPWQADLIEDPSVLETTVNVPAPGDGIIVFTGAVGWVSTADTPEKQEAVWAFIKFAYSAEEQERRSVTVNTFPAIELEFSEEARAQLPAMNVALADAAADATHTYPSLSHVLPPQFLDAWRNFWPAYVQGDINTDELLDRLSEAVVS